MSATTSRIIVGAALVAAALGVTLLTRKNAKPKSPAERQDDLRGRVQRGMVKLRAAG